MMPAMLLLPVALAQSLSAVPPGARAVTVMVCDQPDGCTDAYAAMAEHCANQGIPLLDFDVVASAGPAGGDLRAALDKALRKVDAKGDLKSLEAARATLRSTKLTLPNDEPFTLWLRIGAARLAAGDKAKADEAFEAAASTSNRRVYDLPELPTAALDRYLQIAVPTDEVSTLSIGADADAVSIFIDGKRAGTAPVLVNVVPGWHRISAERTGRRTAWTGEVEIRPGNTARVEVSVADDDAPAALEAAVVGAIRGVTPPPGTGAQIATWAKGQGLDTIRFVKVGKAGQGTPEERIEGHTGTWDVEATWLDVSSRRFDKYGPGPAALRAAADPDRFLLGVNLGYRRLQGTLTTGPDPHDQLDTEIVGQVMIAPSLALDARVGVWQSAQPFYLYEEVLTQAVVPVAIGVRWSPGDSGVYVGAHGLAVIPFALGGEGFAGWAWKPTPRWRIGLEANGGYTDRGAIFGGGIAVAFAG